MAYIKLIFSSTSRSTKKIDRHHQTVHKGGTWKICQRLYMIGQKRELRYQNWIRNVVVNVWWTVESCWVEYVQRVNAKCLGSRDLRLAPSLLLSLLSCGSWRRVVCPKCTDVPEDDPKRRHISPDCTTLHPRNKHEVLKSLRLRTGTTGVSCDAVMKFRVA